MLFTELYYIVVYNKLRWDVYVNICSDIHVYGMALSFLPIYHWGVTYLYIGVIPTIVIWYIYWCALLTPLRYVTTFSYCVNTFSSERVLFTGNGNYIWHLITWDKYLSFLWQGTILSRKLSRYFISKIFISDITSLRLHNIVVLTSVK